MRVVRNPDTEFAKAIKKDIKKNGGYCVSTFFRDIYTMCPCKEFRDQDEPGMCRCGLYMKVEDDDNE